MSRDGGRGGGRHRDLGGRYVGAAAAEEPAGGAAEFPEAPPERARRSPKAGWRRRPCMPAPSARSATPSRSCRKANSSARSVDTGRTARRSAPGPGHQVGETGVTASRLLKCWGRLRRARRCRVGLSLAATSPQRRRDPMQTLISPQPCQGPPSPSTGRQGAVFALSC